MRAGNRNSRMLAHEAIAAASGMGRIEVGTKSFKRAFDAIASV